MPYAIAAYPEYASTGAGWLPHVPAHWNTLRAKYVLREIDTRWGEKSAQLLSVSQYTGVSKRRLREGTDEAATRSASLQGYKVVAPNDLAVNIMLAWNGSMGVSPFAGVVSPAYCVYRFRRGDPWYFHHLLRSPDYRSEIKRRSRGVVESRLRLYSDDLFKIPLLIPPPEEQAAIVRFVAALDRRVNRFIRAKRRLIEVLNEQKQAIITHAVTRGLNPSARLKPSGIDWLGDVPEHWEMWQIGHFAVVGNGSTPSRANTRYWNGGTFPWLNSSSVNAGIITRADQFVTEAALRECHLPRVPSQSVLVAITGQGKTRGMAAVLSLESTINQHVAYIRPRANSMTATPEYLRLFLQAAYPALRRMSDDSGSTKGALTCGGLRHFKVALMPRDEQGALVTVAAEQTRVVDATIVGTEREIDLIREYRTRLVSDVVTGKLDVRGHPWAEPRDEEEGPEAESDGGAFPSVGQESLPDDEPEGAMDLEEAGA